MPAAVDLAAFRIVQEALTNAVRHAPDRPVSVRLERTVEELRIDVEDDPSTALALSQTISGRTGFGLVGCTNGRLRSVAG